MTRRQLRGRWFGALSVFVLLSLSAEHGSSAPGSRDRLKELVSQLQQNAGDHELRERIIDLALTLKPVPAVPDEAEMLAGKARYRFENAKSPADFARAAEAYEQALLLAPWHGDYYFNLGVSQQKAGKFPGAIRSLKLYLRTNPRGKDRKEAFALLGALEAAGEDAAQSASAERRAREERDEIEAVLMSFRRRVEGRRYTRHVCYVEGDPGGCNLQEANSRNWHGFGNDQYHFVISGQTVQLSSYGTPPGEKTQRFINYVGTPSKSKSQSISWERFIVGGTHIAIRADDVADPRYTREAVWFYDGGSQFQFSVNRPINDAEFSPATRYTYELYSHE